MSLTSRVTGIFYLNYLLNETTYYYFQGTYGRVDDSGDKGNENHQKVVSFVPLPADLGSERPANSDPGENQIPAFDELLPTTDDFLTAERILYGVSVCMSSIDCDILSII